MFGVGVLELGVIMVVAVLVLGPDKLPGLAKQAAQMVRMLKRFSEGARDELRDQLGPGYADLELRDLDPRTIVRKHVLDAWADDGDLSSPNSSSGEGDLDVDEHLDRRNA